MADEQQPVEVIQSLADFTNWAYSLRQCWQSTEADKEIWFRGEERKFPHPLRPQLYRPPPDGCMKAVRSLLEKEHRIYEDFKRCAVQLHEGSANSDDWDWDSYFLMQHHNAPTRLLDWSDGALMALHFAIRKRIDCQDENPVVYALEPYRLIDRLEPLYDEAGYKEKWRSYLTANPALEYSADEWDNMYLPIDTPELPVPRLPLLLEFRHITRRIAAQRSRFIVIGQEYDWLAREELVRANDSYIRKVEIDINAARRLRAELRESGITESVIYPDLDGLGREMKQSWEDWNSHPCVS